MTIKVSVMGRGRVAKDRQQCNGRIVAAARFDGSYATLCNHIEGNVLVGRLCGAKFKSAIVAGFRLSQLFGLARACSP
jgi:hypothetical protein